jgi:hypothetical protein
MEVPLRKCIGKVCVNPSQKAVFELVERPVHFFCGSNMGIVSSLTPLIQRVLDEEGFDGGEYIVEVNYTESTVDVVFLDLDMVTVRLSKYGPREGKWRLAEIREKFSREPRIVERYRTKT